MMPTPTVSIVTAAYEAAQDLPETIASVLAQTFEDWEWLVVDDGSADGTASIAGSTGDPRIVVRTVPHSGLPAVARNVALEHARGRYVALLDADDVWEPNKLEVQVALLDRRPAVGLVHAGADLLVHGTRVPVPEVPDVTPAGLVHENPVASSSVVVRRELLQRYGAFDPDPGLWGSIDYELWLRLLPHTEFAYIPEPLVVYRVHERQMSADRDRMDAGALLALEKTRDANPGLAAEYARSIGILRCTTRRPGRGRRELLDALRRNPGDALAWSWLARAIVGPRAVRRAGRALRRLRRRSGPGRVDDVV